MLPYLTIKHPEIRYRAIRQIIHNDYMLGWSYSRTALDSRDDSRCHTTSWQDHGDDVTDSVVAH